MLTFTILWTKETKTSDQVQVAKFSTLSISSKLIGRPPQSLVLARCSLLVAKLGSKTTIQYNTIQYNTIQYNTIQYNTIQYSTVQYSTVQYSTVQYSTVQYSTVQYSTVQYSTVQYSTVQYSTVQYSTVQYNNLFAFPFEIGLQEIYIYFFFFYDNINKTRCLIFLMCRPMPMIRWVAQVLIYLLKSVPTYKKNNC